MNDNCYSIVTTFMENSGTYIYNTCVFDSFYKANVYLQMKIKEMNMYKISDDDRMEWTTDDGTKIALIESQLNETYEDRIARLQPYYKSKIRERELRNSITKTAHTINVRNTFN